MSVRTCLSCKCETNFSEDGFCNACGRNEAASLSYLALKNSVPSKSDLVLDMASALVESTIAQIQKYVFNPLLFAAFASAAVFALWSVNWQPIWSSELTVYRAICQGEMKGERCSGKELSLPAISFKAVEESQAVIYWAGADSPSRLDMCVVRNAKNWACGNPDISNIGQEMRDGEYLEIDLATGNQAGGIYYQIPKWRWGYLRISEFIR